MPTKQDKFWYKMGLRYKSLADGYLDIRLFISNKFGVSHKLSKAINFGIDNVQSNLDGIVCSAYLFDIKTLPSYPHIEITGVFYGYAIGVPTLKKYFLPEAEKGMRRTKFLTQG